MNRPTAISLRSMSGFVLLCLTLAACSTMQKGSTGTESLAPEKEAAPISEAAKTPAPATPAPAPAPATSSSTSDTTAAPAQSAPQQPEAAASTAAAAPGGWPEVGAAKSEDVERAKSQLAEQEAQIAKLRAEQDLAKQQAEGAAQPQTQESAAPAAPPVETSQPAPEPATVAKAAEPPSAGETQSAIERPLENSVYFDFDRSTIKDDYDSMLTGHAAYLKSHSDTGVEIQGNCDERGSREYNLALGARRAEAVKRALVIAGADGKRINTVSFGSEKPVATGKDEESYRKNRRADIVY
ncbi:MAG TPA: peptidoglycan-associated lipoprotein Pal [Burkholderiales bacterium]|nr:peptidoglycan-associated lipoprotein Pal [Burkholderiales bacterium]